MIKNAYYLKTKKVAKVGDSFYKDGNKLGKRKTVLVLFEKVSRENRKYSIQYPEHDIEKEKDNYDF